MSLLLDALNRASRDKAAVTAALVHIDPPVSPLAPPWPPVAEPLAPTESPQLTLTSVATPEWPSLELTKLPVESAPESKAQAPEQPPQELTLSEPVAPPTPEPNIAPKQVFAAASSDVTPTQSGPGLAALSLPPRLAESPAVADRAENTAAGTRVAQKILRAKAPAESPTSRRVRVLGGLALVLAVGMGSVLLGVWGDPMMLAQRSGLSGPTTTVVGITAPPTVPVVAPVGAASEALVPNTPAGKPAIPVEVPTHKTAPVANTAPRSQPQRLPFAWVAPVGVMPCPPGTQSPDCRTTTASSGGARTPPQTEPQQASLQSRSSGPSVLEQAYGALTQGRLQEASQAYSQALANNPEERDALLGLAYIAQQQGRKDEAQSYYKRVLRQEPGNAVARSALLMLSPLSDAQDFGSSSRDVAEQNPDSAAAQSVLGHALVRQDRLAEAQLAFFRALQLEPNVARHAFNLAVAWDRLHQYAAAQQYYERAAALVMQVGSDRTSGFSLAEVQTRLTQLRTATNTSRP